MNFLSQVKQLLLDYLFPPRPLPAIDSLPLCLYTGEEDIIPLFEYAHRGVKDLVWEVKYRGNREFAAGVAPFLYDTIVSELDEHTLSEQYGRALLVPAPASAKRLLERGWNQAELLTARIVQCDAAQRLEHAPRALEKIRHTESQTHTSSRLERLENLRGSMRAESLVSGRLVVVVDDVLTTGATFAEAKRALREAGARKVLCIALAH